MAQSTEGDWDDDFDFTGVDIEYADDSDADDSDADGYVAGGVQWSN